MMMCMLSTIPRPVFEDRYIGVPDTTGKIWELDFDADNIANAVTGLTYHCMHPTMDDFPAAWECEKRALEIFGFVIIELVLGDYIFLPVGASEEVYPDVTSLVENIDSIKVDMGGIEVASITALLASIEVARREIDIAATQVDSAAIATTKTDAAAIATTKTDAAIVWGVVGMGLILFALY
jgi:hypothetical protein